MIQLDAQPPIAELNTFLRIDRVLRSVVLAFNRAYSCAV